MSDHILAPYCAARARKSILFPAWQRKITSPREIAGTQTRGTAQATVVIAEEHMRIGTMDFPDPLLEAQRNGSLVVFAGAGVVRAAALQTS